MSLARPNSGREFRAEAFNCVRWVSGGEADAKSCGVARHGGIADGRNEEAGVDE